MQKAGHTAPQELGFFEALLEVLAPLFARGGNEAGAKPLTIPDADLLFRGEYKRTGQHDLLIEDERKSIIVYDYFRPELGRRPDLRSPDGSMLQATTVESLALAAHAGQYAQATPSQAAPQKVIGRVEKVSGTATAIRNGAAVILNPGDIVYENDAVQTGTNSSLGLSFLDGTVFSLSSSARMVLNRMVYDASVPSDAPERNVLKNPRHLPLAQQIQITHQRLLHRDTESALSRDE